MNKPPPIAVEKKTEKESRAAAKAPTVFDAKAWIRDNCAGAHDLRPETLQVVSSFTLIWNLFENNTCDSEANVGKFNGIATSLAERGEVPAEVATALQFWKHRYYDGTTFNALFDGLEFRPNDRREHVEAVLSGARVEPHAQFLAAMIIVYRLRNNLFHGLKEIPTLNDQVHNLDTACRALAAILSSYGVG